MKLKDRNLKLRMTGEDVTLLQSELRQLGYSITDRNGYFGKSTHEAVVQFQKQHGLEVTGEVDEHAAILINRLVESEPSEADQPAEDQVTYFVEGKVASRSSAGVGGLRVEIVDKNVEKDHLLARAVTDENGAYQVNFNDADLRRRGKARPDLQARSFKDDTLLAASDVRYNASNRESLNILLDDKATSALRSEYETLTGTLLNHFKGKLGDLKETDERQDITYLANKTGWDARAVALAALAGQFSTRTREARRRAGIEPAFFYALFRAGLPANESALYQAETKTVEDVWKQAIKQGVIPAALEPRLPQAVEKFRKLSSQRILDGPALAGVSTLKEILSISMGDDSLKQNQFVDLYIRHQDNLDNFWLEVRHKFGETAEKRIKLDGQLAYLTLNNAPLIRKLHGPDGLTAILKLVEDGYYRSQKWQEMIGDDSIPPEIPGEKETEKRIYYANVMAAQMRLSFPTAVVAQMVKSGETPLADGLRNQVHAFLMGHQGRFEIGMQPVEQYVLKNNLQVAPEVTKEVTRIQRVYQITPGDDAMNALLKKGLDSSYAVVRYDRDEFVQAFKDDVGGEANARLIHARAQQVHNAVLNIAISYLTACSAPGIGVHSPAQIINPKPVGPANPNASDVIAYSTLESLFGEMDYCTCEHCRSILSPAAYLVDLLLFCDHQTNGKENPQKVLLERRPDIQHLPLTCENTNIPLPYIDLINETLEYYITNGLSLTNYMGNNTDGSVSKEDLLANPQFVTDAAYTTLASACFPPPLPFHQPLENLRRYFDKFKAPLPEVMEALREKEDLERPNPIDPAHPVEYGWRDILMEELRLSRAEYALLTLRGSTNGNTDVMLTVKLLYGYDPVKPDAEMMAELSSAKNFTRRVGISYEDLIKILKTRFVNPNSTLIPRLERLGVPFSTLKKLKYGLMTELDFMALLPQGLDPAKYGGAIDAPKTDYKPIVAWVKNQANYDNIMSLITLTTPRLPWAALTPYQLGDCLIPTSQPPESAFYYECTTPGTSAGIEPSQWPVTSGKTCEDGTVIWTCRVGLNICNFDTLRFRYADPDKLALQIDAFEFIRMIRFIRLWKKLDWTIEQTDKMITALYPANQAPDDPNDAVNLQRLDDGFLTLLPRLGVIKSVMEALKLKPKKDLLPLLACFAPIDAHGEASLYRQMFSSPALLKLDDAFKDDGYGNFLDGSKKLLMHKEGLRSAFQLTDEEFSLVAADLGYDDNTLLTIPNITAICRRGWLARKLKLSVKEFLLLTQFTGIDPFAAPDPADPPVLCFIELLNRLRAVSLKPVQALYLIWNQDISGKSAPTDSEISSFARILRSGFSAVESEFALTDDPNGQIARTRMAMVYGNDATDLFFGLLCNTLVTEVSYNHGNATLEQFILDAAPGRIAYDDFRKQLSFTGVLSAVIRDALKIGVPLAFEKAVDKLYEENQEVVGSFFARYPELQPLYDAYTFFGSLTSSVAYTHSQSTLEQTILAAAPGRIAYDHAYQRLSFKGILTEAVRDALKNPVEATSQFKIAVDGIYNANQKAINDFFNLSSELASYKDAYLAANDSEEQRRFVLLASFLPELKRRRKRQQALQAISAAAKSNIGFASTVLDDKAVLHATGDIKGPALDDLTALETPGLSVQFFFADNVGGMPNLTRDAEANLAYSSTGNNKLPPNGNNPANAISGIWSGYLEAPENGFYNLRIEADAGATATLILDTAIRPYDRKIVFKSTGGTETWTLDGQKVSETQDGNVWSNDAPIDLRAGTFYAMSLKVEKVKDTLNVRWQSEGRGWEIIPARYLYSATLTNHLRQVYVRFLKTASLAGALKLTAAETSYLASHADYLIGGKGWLNILPIKGSPDKATSTALLKALTALLDFARLKADLTPEDERLLSVLKDPAATHDSDSLLFVLTRWELASLNDLLTRFGKAVADLTHLETFCRVYDAYEWVKKIGISAAALIKAATNEPDATTVRDLQASLRARYDESDWLQVLRPINDEMRGLQRDALVAYILHQMRSDPASAHIDTPEKLFEYFLMDVQMEPCMQTSRIRHALSSVQLFIERCLMNLEPRVAPSSINAKQWEWMKRYRVWEANRKVFLYPENWLEPELRDDQSPFFKEAMSELLQSDITEDRAAVALLNYLSKLDEVAKLEPCGIHFVENDPSKLEDDIAHVVARTAGANRKYYYRRCDPSGWTPWEQIKLDIEDNPVIPVVWKGRLFLFWLRILKQAAANMPQLPNESNKPKTLANVDPSTVIKTDPPVVTVQAMLCWSEYYNGKWQPTKTSDISKPATLGLTDGVLDFDRSAIERWIFEDSNSGTIRIIITGPSAFLLYNTHSLPILEVHSPYSIMDLVGTSTSFTPRFNTFSENLIITYPKINMSPLFRTVLINKVSDRAIVPLHTLQNPWDAPFFYEDSRHVFYVTTQEKFVSVAQWNDLGVTTKPPKMAFDIPPLIFEAIEIIPDRLGPVINQPGFGVIDPSPIEHFIKKGTYIHRGIGSSGTVRFGDKEIGPAGSQMNFIRIR